MPNPQNVLDEDLQTSDNDEEDEMEQIKNYVSKGAEENINEPTTSLTLKKSQEKSKHSATQLDSSSKNIKKASPKKKGNNDPGRISVKIIKLLINEGNINEPDSKGLTPLLKFVEFGRIEIVEYLLTSGANSCKPSNGKTPLSVAVSKENLEIVQLLLKHGAENTILTALFEAIILGNLEIVKTLLEKKVELNVTYRNGCTPLIKAIETSNLDILKEIVEKGANVNMPDKKGRTPLAASLETNNIDIISYLFEKGARFDNAPFYFKKYIEEANLSNIKILVERQKMDINIDLPDCGYSPLTKAVELENLEMVKFFLEQNPDGINKTDGNKSTALAIAVRKQHLPLVKFLLGSGGDLKNVGKKEIEEFENSCEDFALHLQTINEHH